MNRSGRARRAGAGVMTLCRRLDCGHEACARTRQEQASPCSICGEPIGEHSYIAEPESDADFAPVKLTHALCAAKTSQSKEHYP